MKGWSFIIIIVILIIVISSLVFVYMQAQRDSETRNLQGVCLGSCRCMRECKEGEPTFFIPVEDGASECSVNSVNKICCCSGV